MHHHKEDVPAYHSPDTGTLVPNMVEASCVSGYSHAMGSMLYWFFLVFYDQQSLPPHEGRL